MTDIDTHAELAEHLADLHGPEMVYLGHQVTELPSRRLAELESLHAQAHRKLMIDNGQPARDLEHDRAFGKQEWTTDEAVAEFDFVGFAAPFVVVVRKSDGVRGSLEFTHSPRVYFGFTADEEG